MDLSFSYSDRGPGFPPNRPGLDPKPASPLPEGNELQNIKATEHGTRTPLFR
jgi:hypothetical protein